MLLRKYYYPPVNYHSVWFSEMVLRNLMNNGTKVGSDDVILDIGCGLGNHCFSLLDYAPKEIYGFDISKETIDLLNTFTDKIIFRNIDICKDDISALKNKFTIIFSSDVYEHVEDPQVMLDNIYSMLQTGGKVSITFPNLDDHGHNQLESVNEFTEKLVKSGFKDFEISIVQGLTFPYKVFSKMYIMLQNISDKMYGIKRGANRMPESDEFHEMYAFKKINKIKNKTVLVRFINVCYDIMKKLSRLSSVFTVVKPGESIKNKRILFFARK